MQGLALTRHFVERWEQRVGNYPTVEAVRNLLAQSVRVQWCEDFIRQDGSPFRMLAIYWHPELDLVMKVDTEERVAVTVISRDRYSKRKLETAIPPGKRSIIDLVPALAARIARVRERFGFRTARGSN